MNLKTILTDCDGCLMNWEYAFDQWMASHGFQNHDKYSYNISTRYNIPVSQSKQLVKTFNESANIGFLPPLRDAVYYVKRLHEEHGYKFQCITSLTTDENACKLRKMNLENLFGTSTFEKFIFLDTGADKDDVLKNYQNSNLFWIEDKIKNCEAGLKYGLNPILITHDYNQKYENNNILKANCWKDIYDIITSSLND
jgi:FMN phosphatase YigB (HAD superfamily)